MFFDVLDTITNDFFKDAEIFIKKQKAKQIKNKRFYYYIPFKDKEILLNNPHKFFKLIENWNKLTGDNLQIKRKYK